MAASDQIHDVVIVGAGPAGIGVAAALRRIGVTPTLIDRTGIGASFEAWPEAMRLISPSFTSNQFGLVDLNAVTPNTSPALSLLEQHPTGRQYAQYLRMVADLEGLAVRRGITVRDVCPDGGHLLVEAGAQAALRARTVVWAAGEAGTPRRNGFPGAERCVPTITVRHWDEHPGGEVVVVGGFESGIDAAVNLVARGRRVTVLDHHQPWATVDPDPSRTLSPSTRSRLREATATGHLHLVGDVHVAAVHAQAPGYEVLTDDGRSWRSEGPPLLATGFEGSLRQVAHRFAWDADGLVEVSEQADESTLTPGLFLAGPMLSHRGASFCFIYKFRQRFGVVARAIGQRLGIDTSPLEALRAPGFLLDDLSCCEDCAC